MFVLTQISKVVSVLICSVCVRGRARVCVGFSLSVCEVPHCLCRVLSKNSVLDGVLCESSYATALPSLTFLEALAASHMSRGIVPSLFLVMLSATNHDGGYVAVSATNPAVVAPTLHCRVNASHASK